MVKSEILLDRTYFPTNNSFVLDMRLEKDTLILRISTDLRVPKLTSPSQDWDRMAFI